MKIALQEAKKAGQIGEVPVGAIIVSENGEILMRSTNPDEDHIRLDIIDNGVGIDPVDIPHIFEGSRPQLLTGKNISLSPEP